MPFQKGQSGNPKGRPEGARDKLSHAFWRDFHETWREGGKEALVKVRSEDPSTYVRVAASLMPKETELTVRRVVAQELSDNELANIATGSGDGTDTPPIDPSQLN